MKRTIALCTLVVSLVVFGLGPVSAGNLEDKFLNGLKKEQVPVSIYLVNGIKLQGQISDFTDNIIILGGAAVDQMVYIHAISTVVPARNVLSYE